MTTPNVVWEFPIQSYVLGATSAGFQFAKAQVPEIPVKPWEIPLPVGVNTVQVVYSGESAVTTDVRVPGREHVKPSRLQLPAGVGTRLVVTEIPVSDPKTVITFTLANVLQREVGQPILGVKIITAPPAQ